LLVAAVGEGADEVLDVERATQLVDLVGRVLLVGLPVELLAHGLADDERDPVGVLPEEVAFDPAGGDPVVEDVGVERDVGRHAMRSAGRLPGLLESLAGFLVVVVVDDARAKAGVLDVLPGGQLVGEVGVAGAVLVAGVGERVGGDEAAQAAAARVVAEQLEVVERILDPQAAGVLVEEVEQDLQVLGLGVDRALRCHRGPPPR
jgi:hypothetical protein